MMTDELAAAKDRHPSQPDAADAHERELRAVELRRRQQARRRNRQRLAEREAVYRTTVPPRLTR